MNLSYEGLFGSGSCEVPPMPIFTSTESKPVAVMCPVCRGRTWMDSEFYNPTPPGVYRASTTIPMRETCRSCLGRGIITT